MPDWQNLIFGKKKKKKVDPLVDSSHRTRGGVRATRRPGQVKQTERLPPALLCLTMVAMEAIFQFIIVVTCPGCVMSDTSLCQLHL